MNQNKAYFLIFLTAFISGFAVFISKFGVSVINPYIFTGLKNFIVVLLVASWLLMMKDWRLLKNLKRKSWGLLFAVGLIGGSVPFLLFFKGLSVAGGAEAAFIHKTMFIYIAVLASVFLKEKIGKDFLIGGLLLVLGNLLLFEFLPVNFNFGSLLILLATLLWAGENILSKYLLKDLPSRIVIFGRMFFGSLFILLFWFFTGQAYLTLSLNLEQIGWILITSVFLFGYVATWYSGLKYVKVSVAATILLLGSPITAFLSMLFLNDSISIAQFGGMGLILAAVFIVMYNQCFNEHRKESVIGF